MMRLLAFGPHDGLPSASPFSTKAMVLLRMAGAPYELVPSSPQKAPKGKLPVLVDGGTVVPDSGFIRLHLEDTRGVDFDEGLDARERAAARGMVALAEDRLYFAAMAERWRPENRRPIADMLRGSGVPGPVAGPLARVLLRSVRRDLKGQGMGRHTDAERLRIVSEVVGAFADQLGDRPFLMGERPTAADASVWPMLLPARAAGMAPSLAAEVEARPALGRYLDRMGERFAGLFP